MSRLATSKVGALAAAGAAGAESTALPALAFGAPDGVSRPGVPAAEDACVAGRDPKDMFLPLIELAGVEAWPGVEAASEEASLTLPNLTDEAADGATVIRL